LSLKFEKVIRVTYDCINPLMAQYLGRKLREEERAYDKQPPVCIHHLIDWKLALNKRIVVSDTD
jgi:hypothetical protein